MDLRLYLAFFGVSLLVICTPGQDTALTIRNTLLGNRSTGSATAVGVAMGQAVWTLAASAGLAVVLMASASLFLAIRLAGAAYLIYLGGRSLISALRNQDRPTFARPESMPRLSLRTSLLQGLLSNLSNPKMVAFFVGLLPAFAGPRASFVPMFALGLNFCLLTLLWLLGYAFAVERTRRWLHRSMVWRAIDGLVGAVLVALGMRVAVEAVVA